MHPLRSGRTLVRAAGALTLLGALAAPCWPAGIENLGFLDDRALRMNDRQHEGPRSRYVRISHAGAVSTPEGPALHLHVTNIAGGPIRVAVTFDAPGRSTDCSTTADLVPAAGQSYVCPQPILRTGVEYPVTIEIRRVENEKAVERIRRLYRFDKDHVAALSARARNRLDG